MKRKVQETPMPMNEIPIFFACDEHFVKYTCVAIRSLMANASKQYQYHIHILCTHISEEKKQKAYALATDYVKITFDDVSRELSALKSRLHIRDYYSVTTYYRIFIADKFPQYDKIIYLDSDMIVLQDISELYFTDLCGDAVGAVRDQVIIQTEIFSEYAEKVLGIDRNSYFNAGMLVMDCNIFRKNQMLDQFVELLNSYAFVVAQDQDYLNVLCEGSVFWLNPKWNVETYGKLPVPIEDTAIIHYNLANKPWHYKDALYADYFWKYAEQTEDYDLLVYQLENYSEGQRQKDLLAGDNLFQLAVSEIENENNYLKMLRKSITNAKGRRSILEKIALYEKEGRFDEDVEEDPPTIELLPENIDYLNKTLRERMRTRNAFKFARWFMNFLIYRKQLIVKDIQGIENLRNLESGAIITCNHFSALDSFIIQMVYDESRQRKRGFYRVIREGNYTNFPGFYGYLMRNCNTLPLSSNVHTMKKFLQAVDTLLQAGNFILIYPEQSMWWNYRKPKPLKNGGYKFAAKNHVPVVPCFVTMEDTDMLDTDGYPVQEYTVHVSEPIWPEEGKPVAENAERMKEKNYQVWKDIYEKVYGIPLVYTCDEGKE